MLIVCDLVSNLFWNKTFINGKNISVLLIIILDIEAYHFKTIRVHDHMPFLYFSMFVNLLIINLNAIHRPLSRELWGKCIAM